MIVTQEVWMLIDLHMKVDMAVGVDVDGALIVLHVSVVDLPFLE
jgi:hypothetical protein